MEFEELKRKFDEVKVIAQRQEERVHYYETKAKTIAMAYLKWELFFVVAMSQASSSMSLNYCTHFWVVLGFTLSSNCLYLMFFLEAFFMLYWAHNHLEIIWKKRIEISQQILNEVRTSISSDGLELDLSFHVELLDQSYQYPFTILLRKVCIFITICALFGVAAFELYSLNLLLCNSTHAH